MDTKALRQKILDLAIRGKLVPQDPNDEPASVLLERIRAEKQQMVKDGKLKAKDIKNDTVIFKGDDNLHYEQFADGTVKCIEDEIPFELPEGWVWCRGYSCFKGMESLKPQGEYFDYIDIDAIDNKSHKISAVKHLLVKEAPSRASRRLENGSVLFSFVRPYLENIAFVDENFSHCIASTGFYICNSNGIINPNFMFVLMTSKYVIDGLNSFMKGDNSPSIKKEEIENFLYPIPPISEQQRIIDRINSVFPIIENLAVQKNNLQKESISIKSKILDLAIRGKLVPQDPNDEPASVLLERIRAEKEELIKQGKIKRDKKESVIFKGEDNSYYDIIIPESWEYVNLIDVALSISDGSHNPPPKKNSGVPLLSATNIFDNKINYTTATRWITEKEWIIENARTKIEVGDVLVTIVGTIGRTAVVSDATHFALQRSVAVIKPLMIDSKYLMFVLQTPIIVDWLNANARGNAQMGIYLKDLAKLSFPLPPFAEQKRIVEAIEVVFAQLDEITSSIS